MSTLHILSHSPFSDARLDSCLRLLGDADGLLLTGDAVYGLLPNSEAAAKLHAVGQLYALSEDLQARAISPDARVQVVNYPGFVALSLAYHKVNSWL
ncbi:sulfurtransferase complex subunit TusB [Pseudomonas sp. nanlin1]|uniref:sulfurtransferase complex subunit TusB n=1 Tax=Pseudomonas sp. nanlin1 TaxID=3040605 RepID=UPI00388FF7BA